MVPVKTRCAAATVSFDGTVAATSSKACPQRHAFFVALYSCLAGYCHWQIIFSWIILSRIGLSRLVFGQIIGWLCFGLFFSPGAAAGACSLQGEAQSVVVKKVLDGDTVVLTDGRHVRLIGINTPELAHPAKRGRPPQVQEPVALNAQRRLQQLVGGQQVRLQLGVQAVDHYGRALGRLFAANGELVEAMLLREGLGFLVIKAPDFRYRSCVADAAAYARGHNAGVWAERYFLPRDAERIQKTDTGFRRIRDVVSSVAMNRKRWRIMLRGQKVEIKISAKNAARFDRQMISRLAGKVIETSGWLVWQPPASKSKRSVGRYQMQIDDPALLSIR